MKKSLISIAVLSAVSLSASAWTVNGGSGGTISNVLHGQSSTSSFAETTGDGYSRSTGSANSGATSRAAFHGQACPKMGMSSSNSSIWGHTNTSGTTYSTGAAAGGVATNAYTDGSSLATSYENATVSIDRPLLSQDWTGGTETSAYTQMDTGSGMSLGSNSSGGTRTSVDANSRASADWKVNVNRFGISDVKHTNTSGNTVAVSNSWSEGANVLNIGGGANAYNEESADAHVEASSWNGRVYD